LCRAGRVRHPESRLKRREFLAASAVLSLLGSSATYAANKTNAKKPVTKPASKKQTRKKPVAKPAETEPEVRNVISLPDEPLAQWRTYDIHSTISLENVSGKTRLWLPLAQYKDTLWERSLGHNWQGNFANAGIYRDPVAEMEVFYADWPEGAADPHLQLVSQVATQDRHFDITRRGAIAEHTEVLRRCLQQAELVPTDGIVRKTAERAIGRVKDPLALGKAIYDWVVENVEYEPSETKPGNGNIAALLENGNLIGDSTDIALLFVGLCRSIGIPARPVFGLRMDSSRLFASLGASGELQAAQHCRAEFYAPGYGWIPVDPSDVRKAIREEGLLNGDPKLTVLKKLLFGFWEMNWVSFNAAQDVNLRGSAGNALPHLLSPVVESGEGRFGKPEDKRYRYTVTASRVFG
jgi:transglutaminase-like putative cysteine protease